MSTKSDEAAPQCDVPQSTPASSATSEAQAQPSTALSPPPLQAEPAEGFTPLPGGGSIRDVYGDLMTATDSLAHCVSACLAMGKGIATLFKDRFKSVDTLKAQRVDVGGVAVLPRPEENRFIYYLVTKPRFFHVPTYQTLAASLTAMLHHMRANGITSVSMPEIGCGLDGLQWPRVRRLLEETFADTGVHVTIYHFTPDKPRVGAQERKRVGAPRGKSGGRAAK